MSKKGLEQEENEETSCNVCLKPFKSKYSMQRHFRILHEGIMPYTCECGKSFGTQDQYDKHFIAKHSKQRPIKCNRGCDKYFSTINARYYHTKVYHENIRFKCVHEGCKCSYTSAALLRSHVKRVHNSDRSVRTEAHIDSVQTNEENRSGPTNSSSIQEEELEEWEKMINYF